eukprot:CAMPEP_0194068850 /NCGR_PEP_ID=MMETSP0009_2-20130614/87320_1 /TAXON_ID=210454 /ORGANISM="Grammatophora oceanica, Strain CCMP 410" /LENGTH=34 /DNA_ID= /DNA_START= /DNA_END= /DNA_ORIENTATION=
MTSETPDYIRTFYSLDKQGTTTFQGLEINSRMNG